MKMLQANVERLKIFKFLLIIAMVIFIFPAYASSSLGNAANDTAITSKIKASFLTNDITRDSNITVETNDGVVNLRGVAKSDTEAEKAVEISASTAGVVSVNTAGLQVTGSTQPMTDAYITAKVKGVFVKNNLTVGETNVPLTDVKVETQKGVVYLSGKVRNDAQADKLIALSRSVDGVIGVKSSLKVSS